MNTALRKKISCVRYRNYERNIFAWKAKLFKNKCHVGIHSEMDIIPENMPLEHISKIIIPDVVPRASLYYNLQKVYNNKTKRKSCLKNQLSHILIFYPFFLYIFIFDRCPVLTLWHCITLSKCLVGLNRIWRQIYINIILTKRVLFRFELYESDTWQSLLYEWHLLLFLWIRPQHAHFLYSIKFEYIVISGSKLKSVIYHQHRSFISYFL